MKSLSASLKELFEIQAGLDSEILQKYPVQAGENRLEKKHTALLVELGEMMNEVRQFKFWSKDQKRRTEVNIECKICFGSTDENYEMIQEDAEGSGDHEYIPCESCNATGVARVADRVLEELVDVLHFALSIGLEHEFDEMLPLDIDPMICYKGNINQVEYQFIDVIKADWNVYEEGGGGYYHEGLELFLGFCQILGYTWEQINAAYLEKNQINHRRLQSGY